MAVRTNVLIGASTVAGGGVATYTVPSGVRTIVKYVSFRFAGADLCSVDIRDVGLTSRQVINRTGAGNNTSIELAPYLVLISGEQLRLVNRGANSMNVYASGVELLI